MFFPLWEGWILNNVLYFLLIVGPVLRLTGRKVALWKESHAGGFIIKEVSPARITSCLIISLVVPVGIAICLGFGVERQLSMLEETQGGERMEEILSQLHYSKSAQDILLVIVGFLGCTSIYFFSLLFRQIFLVRKELAKLSITDSLTGLRNRRYAESQLDAQFKRFELHGSPCSLIMLDLDYFKSVNDRYGHAAGDRTLQEIARYTAQNTRDSDIRARYGGEEFLIISPNADIDGARGLAERLRRFIEEHPVEWDGTLIPITASFGTSELSPDDPDPYRAVSRADEALYTSKRDGRNRVT